MAAEEKAAWLATFPELNPNPIVEVDVTAGVIYYINPAAHQLFPDLESRALGHPFLTGLEFVAATLAEGSIAVVRREVLVGSQHYVQNISFVQQLGRLRIYSTDITDRKIAETHAEEFATATLSVQAAELRRANEALERSNVELQQFAYIASHDLQTPLRTISGFVQLLQLNYSDKLDDQGQDWIRRTIQACEQMHTLIRDVLAYSRVDAKAVPFQPVKLSQVFADAATALDSTIRELGGRVTSGDLPVVMGDRSQLVQLMQNLLGNALKYHGGEQPRVHVSALLKGVDWVITVRDNGIGIASKHHDRIFEIFRICIPSRNIPGPE